MAIPKNINRDHVILAIQKIDREGIPEKRESTRFNLTYESKYYPPKYVISIANIFANGEEYSPSLFSGGEETNKFLNNLGFIIVENNLNGTDDEKEKTDFKLEVPAIRLLPMSENDPEFTGKSIDEVQEWFINELPYRKYNFKNGMNAASGTLVLFQYKGHVIASAILEEKIMYDEDNEGSYRGAYYFTPTSIAVFTPITTEEMGIIWIQFKGFNQSLQKLDVNQYELLCQLLLRKNIRYLFDKDVDEDSFQKQVETVSINHNDGVVDKPREKKGYFYSSSQKLIRNPVYSKRAITSAKYLCEIDANHKDFISKVTGQNYVEAHHLIPMEYQDDFDKSIDIEANIVSLCVSCHKKLHHAVFEEKEEVLKTLYNNRTDRLRKCGINLREENLLSYYE
ncbi:hypothetical protein [Bacillus sp. EB600]|uniref:HNH endonuclease n=1 Tax=Bacillus sp. EB600 TaxID=2806345 RepID=UPI002108FC9C|nr:hypothetical protein [Bacillus sp. EB600]MCQ6281610.1 hypothetical protein [Bacillus sp. EB600]